MNQKLQTIAETLESHGRDVLSARQNIRMMMDALRQVQDAPEVGNLQEVTDLLESAYRKNSDICVRLRQLSMKT